jgi:RNA polymerase sigma-70 factor (ECF subfamily)
VLFREHHPAVRAYARRRVPRAAVDDIVSETFLVVWRWLDQVPEPALPWLLTVAGTDWQGAVRRERLWLKAQSRHVESYDLPEPDTTDGNVPGALGGLKERDREALTLMADAR